MPRTSHSPTRTGRPTADVLFETLAHPARRRLLSLLAESEADEGGQPCLFTPALVEEHRRLSRMELYHVHLPKLAEAGYVEWDRDDQVILAGPRFDEVEAVVSLLREHREALPFEWP